MHTLMKGLNSVCMYVCMDSFWSVSVRGGLPTRALVVVLLCPQETVGTLVADLSRRPKASVDGLASSRRFASPGKVVRKTRCITDPYN